ncbi:MAG: hypothetical protein Q8O24_06010 [Gallionellaceae bacterium]|nr:hypothetical protein [Gallionellaceae bacterium]
MKQLLEEIVRRPRGRDIGMKNLLVLIGLACTLGGRLKSAHFLWAILIGLPLSAQADALPFSYWKDDSHVSVVISPSVQQMIQQANQKESTNIKRAIKVGNIFVRRRFNNDDQYDAEFDELWSKIVGPLMAMSGEEWGVIWAERWTTYRSVGKHGVSVLLACPEVNLTEIKTKPDGINLIYRATLIGSYIRDYPKIGIHSIDKARSGQSYELRVEIGSRGKITDVTSSEKELAYEYHYQKKSMKRAVQMYKNQAAAGRGGAKFLEEVKTLNVVISKAISELDAATSICSTSEASH